MSDAIGIKFKEVLSGGFVLGEVLPEKGQEAGKLQGSALTMRSEIVISDVEAFVDDPAHAAELRATVDFAPLGTGIEGAQGTFNLFKPSDREGVKLMEYRFGFEHVGKVYYFVGQKFVHEGSSIRKLWEESTHLYVRLHEGVSEEGLVVGAGILEIGVSGVVDLVKSMRVVGTESSVKKAEALARFGKFFLGELWDTYSANLPVLGDD